MDLCVSTSTELRGLPWPMGHPILTANGPCVSGYRLRFCRGFLNDQRGRRIRDPRSAMHLYVEGDGGTV